MAPLLAALIVFCPFLVAPLAIVVLWPRHRLWLPPLLILPWVASLTMIPVSPHTTGFYMLPPMLGILLPLLALVIDRWESLRNHKGFWIALAVGVGLIGAITWSGAAGELGLNQDGQYCRDIGSSEGDCRLDPLKVVNVYLTMLGFVVLAIGPIPSLILFSWIGYRRWFSKSPGRSATAM